MSLTTQNADTTKRCISPFDYTSKCLLHVDGDDKVCPYHYNIYEFLSNPIYWNEAKNFFDNHIYCGYGRTKYYIEYFTFLPKDKWDGDSKPTDFKYLKDIVHIFNDSECSLYQLINIDGTYEFDPNIHPEDYQRILKKI